MADEEKSKEQEKSKRKQKELLKLKEQHNRLQEKQLLMKDKNVTIGGPSKNEEIKESAANENKIER